VLTVTGPPALLGGRVAPPEENLAHHFVNSAPCHVEQPRKTTCGPMLYCSALRVRPPVSAFTVGAYLCSGDRTNDAGSRRGDDISPRRAAESWEAKT